MTKKYLSSTITIAVSVLLLVLASLYAPPGEFNKVGAWYCLIPPLIAIILAIATHKLAISLFTALVSACWIYGYANESGVFEVAWASASFFDASLFKVISDPWSWRVAVFVMLILAMSSVIIVAGGLRGIANWLERYARDARSTQFVTFLLGVIIFIDDYANTMIVGSTMRPFSDRYRVSREKLAFLVDATSAPVAGLAIVSTWIAFEVGLFETVSSSLKLGMNGYEMFFDAWAYRYYCLFLLLFVVVNIVSRRDFGAMLHAERRAHSTGELVAKNSKPLTSNAYAIDEMDPAATARASTAVIPLTVLLSVFIIGLWLSGGGWQMASHEVRSLASLSAWREILSNANNSVVLLTASSSGLLCACYFALKVAKISTFRLRRALYSGARNAIIPMGILVLAWALKNSFEGIHLGDFLLASIGGSVSALWFPALVFATASIVALGIGSSWGTMSLLLPILIPFAYALDGQHYGLTTIICLGAVLDGAIFGDHCSPVSDTTIMSSIASSCDHIDHVKTQLPYSLTVALIALACGYLPSAFGIPYIVGWVMAIVSLLALFFLVGKTNDKKQHGSISPSPHH